MEYHAGDFKGKILDYGFRASNSGNLSIAVLFEYDQKGETRKLTWWGYLNEGMARQITLKALKLMGWVGQELSCLADGVQTGVLDTDKEFSLKVALEEYNGETRPRIKWVNESGMSIKEKVSMSDVKQHLGGMNLKADVVALFGNVPAQETKPAFASENIPF